jgi:hypothetical protein
MFFFFKKKTCSHLFIFYPEARPQVGKKDPIGTGLLEPATILIGFGLAGHAAVGRRRKNYVIRQNGKIERSTL